MKKFLTIVAALALVLGLSQCKKPNVPEYTGPIGDRYLQHITVGATNGIGNNGNSKVDVDPEGPNMNLTWQEDDKLYVFNNGVIAYKDEPLVLSEGATTSKGKFDGEILAGKDDELTFIYKGSDVTLNDDGTFEIDYNDQTGTLEWLKSHLVLKADNVPFTPNVSDYNATLTAPYAIVFLDLSSFGKTTKDGVDVTIKKGEDTNPVATVKGVTTASNKMYVVMPTDSNKQTYTLTNGDKTVKYTWTLAGCNYYTAAGTGGGPVTDCFCFTAKQAGSTVKIKFGGFKYSTDGINFKDYEDDSTINLTNDGDKVYFKAKSTNETINGMPFETTGNLKVSGNIMYLLNGTTPATTFVSDNEFCFNNLFNEDENECKALSDASELLLPVTDLTGATGCYQSMFYGCANLTAAPALPATTLASDCYSSMFVNCEKLETAPALNATTLAENCYSYMFQFCTKLKTAPALNATTLAENCYKQMFYGCTGLVTAPELPATTLKNSCYAQMFQECTGLVTAPELKAATLTDFCYRKMFQGCTGLVTAPELKATTLANYCYDNMFSGCTGLVTAPELPAATLTIFCYQQMFKGCLKLSSVTMLATTVTANKCLNEWLTNAGTSAATTPTVTVAGGMKTTIEGTLDKNVWTVYDPTPTLTVTTGDIVEMPAYGFCGCSGNASCDPQQNCEVGFVHSSSNTEPTVGGTGCTTAVSSDNKNVTPSGVSFDKQLLYTNMSAGTNYIRAYAKVNGGSEYVYGEVKTVSVTATISFPTYVRVNGGGNTRCFSTTFKSSLPQNCTYGFVYSTSQNPTVGNGTCVAETTGQLDSSGTDYTSSYIQFQKGTYYVRAYARNASGGDYTYSSDASFTIN